MDMSSVLLSLLFLRFANGRVATGFFDTSSTGYLAHFQLTGSAQDSFTALQYGVNVIGICFYEDGFVILSPTTNEHRINYTIFLGGRRTLTSTIFKNVNGKSEQVAKYVTTARPTNYFWIGWYNGKIQVGLFRNVPKNVIMEYTDPCPFRIHYVAVSRVTHQYWWIYQGVEYQEDTSCKVTHCDSCKRYTLRTQCPAFVMNMSVKVNSEDDCLSRCYKDDECEAFHYDNTAHVCRVFTDEVDPDGEIISPIFRKLP